MPPSPPNNSATKTSVEETQHNTNNNNPTNNNTNYIMYSTSPQNLITNNSNENQNYKINNDNIHESNQMTDTPTTNQHVHSFHLVTDPHIKKKKTVQLSKEIIREHFKYSQIEAAKRLGCSLSTLKRKFAKLFPNLNGWPRKMLNSTNRGKMSISFIVNENSLDCKYIDGESMHVLMRAFLDSNGK